MSSHLRRKAHGAPEEEFADSSRAPSTKLSRGRDSDDSDSVTSSHEESLLDGSIDSHSESDLEATEVSANMPDAMRDISFGALAEAQDSLAAGSNLRKRQRVDAGTEVLADLKARLKKAKTEKPGTSRGLGNGEHHEARRSSKHAPIAQSSTRAVTRFRPAIELSSNPQHIRDPRFSSASTNADLNQDRLRKNYDFLSSYRDTEAADMKTTIASIKLRAKKRKTKQPTADEAEEMESLKRQVNSIENKKKSEDRKAMEREIVRRHRKEEREQIKLGKKPFYLKRGEAKKQAEKERFDSMKGRDKKKLTERREKRKTQKEKRAAPGLGIG